MGLMDKELRQKHVQEERMLRFTEFVEAQKAAKAASRRKK